VTAQKLRSIGIRTIGGIAASTPETLIKLLGKVGGDLWHFAHGDDRSFKPDNQAIKSIGNTITPPSDLADNREASAILYLLTNSVCARLKKHRMQACCISVCMKDTQFNQMIRQVTLKYPTDNPNLMFNTAYALLERHFPWENPLRSVGVRADNLYTLKWEQMSMFRESHQVINVDIDARLKELTARFGVINMEKTATSREWTEGAAGS